MGSKHEKVGNGTTEEAMNVMRINQGGELKDFFQTFRKSHFYGRWSYSSGAQPRTGSGSKTKIIKRQKKKKTTTFYLYYDLPNF